MINILKTTLKDSKNKKNLLKPIFVLVTIFPINHNIAQAVISSSGETLENSSINLEYTLGEIAITDIKDSYNQISQGFHQPSYNISNLGQSNYSNKTIVYPNPVKDNIIIRIPGNFVNKAELKLYDINGLLIFQNNVVFNNEMAEIELTSLSLGIYYLQIIAKNINFFESFKIVKL